MRLNLGNHDLHFCVFDFLCFIGEFYVLSHVDKEEENLNVDYDRKIGNRISWESVLDDDGDKRDDAVNGKGNLLTDCDFFVEDG